MQAALPLDARVLGWDSAALVLPSYGVKVVAFPRPMPLSPSDAARQADVGRFFRRNTSDCDRGAIAMRWGATHVAWLTPELGRPVQRELTRHGAVTAPVGWWRITAAPPPCSAAPAGR